MTRRGFRELWDDGHRPPEPPPPPVGSLAYELEELNQAMVSFQRTVDAALPTVRQAATALAKLATILDSE